MCSQIRAHTTLSADTESLLTGNDKIKRGRKKKGERTTGGGEIIFEQLGVEGGDERLVWG